MRLGKSNKSITMLNFVNYWWPERISFCSEQWRRKVILFLGMWLIQWQILNSYIQLYDFVILVLLWMRGCCLVRRHHMNNFGDDGISCWRMGDFNAVSSAGQLHMCSCSRCGICIRCITIICGSLFNNIK